MFILFHIMYRVAVQIAKFTKTYFYFMMCIVHESWLTRPLQVCLKENAVFYEIFQETD